LDAVRTLRAKGRPFVIDLRGNGGGDDSMGFELARILLGLPDHVNLPTPVASRLFRQTPESFAIQSNGWAYSILKARANGQEVPAYMSQRRDEILSWMERAKNHEFPREYVERLPEPELDESKIFQPEVYILADRGCASACETTMQVLEKLPRRILVGENTFGAVEYGDVGRVILPHSRVSVTLSTMSVQFRDGRRVEKTGYAPDIRVQEGGDALATALSRF
jgi:C-terminal processing protease CtpA/Prc